MHTEFQDSYDEKTESICTNTSGLSKLLHGKYVAKGDKCD